MMGEHHDRCGWGLDISLKCTCDIEMGWDDVMSLAPDQTDEELNTMLEDMAVEHGGNVTKEITREEIQLFCDRYLEWPAAEIITQILASWTNRMNAAQIEGLNRFMADADLSMVAVESQNHAERKLNASWEEYEVAADRLEKTFNRVRGAMLVRQEAALQVASRLESLKESEDAFLGLFLPERLCD